ncbi:putative CyaI3 adenylate/guanylate cyclase [Modestobacter italicus]|uniref:CyaI3 adenylate/guanylate cyclase n=1 Tax=Modestobacter italicus (strain DSM 44449 / CECT 9708 / BC 501) TaxID=2732864 RepID=I4EVS6_MODI5|nr:adenylate/guanylate cyclase domain-containing protein [Modestobacter marinus]CCH87489.1 putative CyaI3 adenylate/guanylate cyclase [Modestobacter marinus]
MTDLALSAEVRLERLLDRLLRSAETLLAAGELELARSTAEEVRAVDPDNPRAAAVLRRVSVRQLGPSGERVLMTLLFSDLVGSTMLSEQVEPEQLRDLFAFYRAAARAAVDRYSGYVMQYTGDGILAGFGHPTTHEDDARRAVLAALDLVVTMRDARPELDRRFGVAPELRVGIHTGRLVVTDLSGDDGVAERDSIVGLVPNLAARVQQAADPGMVVISDVTQQLVDADFVMRSLGERHLKGISRPVEVFAVERPRYAAARFEAERYRQAGLVGRDGPRDRLLAAWDGVRETTGPAATGTFLLVGEAGIGKSRLVAEVLDRVEASGGRVLGAACLPYHANVSLWPVTQLLEREVGPVADDAGRLPALVAHLDQLGVDPARAVPFLGPLLGIPPTPEHPAPALDPTALLDETLDRLVEWVSARTARPPYLVAVEDLHWADPSTLELLGRLVARRLPGVLLVTTGREDAVVPWRDAVEVLQLRRLDEAAATRLVENLTAGRGLSADQRASIIAHAEGIPLFVEELTRSSLDEHRTDPMPLRLQELFTWRLKAPGIDLRVVQVAATVGPTFDAATVAAVVEDRDVVAEQLGLLAEQGIVEPAGPAVASYRFRHALMRDAAYETQVLDVRRQTHARVADALSAAGAEPALVAQHLDLAGEAERAAALYLVAGQAQHARGAHTEATKLLSRAVDLLADLPASENRDLSELSARLLRGLSVSSMHGYAAPMVQSDHRRAEELAARLGRPEVLPALIALWGYRLTSGDLFTARGVIERLSAMVQEAPFSGFRPEVASCAGFLDLHQGRLLSAPAHLHAALAGFAARPPDLTVSPVWPLPNDPVAGSAIALACVSAARGELGEAARWEAEALRRARALAPPLGPSSLAFVQVYAAWIRRFLGDDDGARRLGAEVVALGREHGSTYWTTLGMVYQGAPEPGGVPDRAFVEQVVGTLRLMGQEAFTASHLIYLARLDEAAGEVGRAAQHIADGIAAVRSAGEFLHLPGLLRLRAGYALALGEPPGQPVADLREAVRLAVEQGSRVTRLRAAVELARVPGADRPADWRTVLAEARADLPSAFTSAETAEADALLGT